VLDHVFGRISSATFDQHLDRIVDFEQTLADDGRSS